MILPITTFRYINPWRLPRVFLHRDGCGLGVLHEEGFVMPAYWKIPKTEGLYFLFNGDELVYIGSTESSGIRNRVYAHEYEDKKQFTSMAFLMKEDLLLNLRDAETYLIIKYSPRYNQPDTIPST